MREKSKKNGKPPKSPEMSETAAGRRLYFFRPVRAES